MRSKITKKRTIESALVSSSSTKSQTFQKFRTPSGHTVNSRLEAQVAEHLDSLGHSYAYEPSRIDYVVERYYVPDFVLENGIHIECKGWFLSEDRRKMKLVKKQHPDLDIRFVFSKLDAKGQQSKVTNRVWCKKNGFPCAEGVIPEAWLNE